MKSGSYMLGLASCFRIYEKSNFQDEFGCTNAMEYLGQDNAISFLYNQKSFE